MVKKYFEFINENFELILESDVKYSEKLRKVLKKIGGPVSDSLLDIENKDYPVQSNYFDISDANDTISFTPDRKVKEILDNNKNKWRYSITGKFLDSDSRFNYLWEPLELERKQIETEPPIGTMGTLGKEVISPVSQKKFVVFIPDDTEYKPIPVNIEALRLGSGEDPSDFFKISRQIIRVGRGVRTLLNTAKVEISDKEIEDFVNKYKATIDSINDIFSNFEIVNGYSIAEWYDYERYEKGTDRGTLGSSCMANVSDDFFDIYCSNPDKISLVIYKSPDSPNKIRGRALVWKLNDDKMFMDRIYTHEDSDVELFRQYAKKNGFYCKYQNSSGTGNDTFAPDGSVRRIELDVKLKPRRYDNYPYLDTLKYYNPEKGEIGNCRSSGSLTLEDTDGGYSGGECERCGGDGEYECGECDGRGDVICSVCDGNEVIECDKCSGDGEEACAVCKGTGKIEDDGISISCNNPYCVEGIIKCSKCGGDGEVECDNCDGNGRTTCEECNGNGMISCDNC